MMSRLSKRPLLLVGLCAVVLVVALLSSCDYRSFIVGAGSSYFFAEGQIVSQQRAYWVDRVRTVGGAEAYRELAEDIADKPPVLQHTEAHDFGSVLYEAEGVSGFSACDMQFSMGCYHEFLGQAIVHEGEAVVSKLTESCDTLPKNISKSGCRHGIGHGIQAWLGYEPEDLLKGIRLCNSLRQVYRDQFGGCSSGLYMEYNLRVMLGSSTPFRELQHGNYFAPCDLVPEEERPICVFWLPQWWSSLEDVIGQPGVYPAIYKKIGQHCRDLQLPRKLEDACFQGIGATLSGVGGSPATAVEACKLAGKTAREVLLCRGLVAAVYKSEDRADAEAPCEGLVDRDLEYCRAYATGEADFLNMIPTPTAL